MAAVAQVPLNPDIGAGDRLSFTLFLALALHAALILGVTFTASPERSFTPQLEVTLARFKSSTAPEESRYVAQANQEGSGEQAQEESVTSRNNRLPTESEMPEQSALREAENIADNTPEVVDTVARAQHAVAEAEEERSQQPLEGINPELDELNRQLAGLEAELDEQTRTLSDRPRTRRLTSVATREAADAATDLRAAEEAG